MGKNTEVNATENTVENPVLATGGEIQSLIYVLRGRQIMLDSDLAKLYGVETRTLNQAVKRNSSRFPEHFRFQLTKDDLENLKSQIVISSLEMTNYGGRRFMPYAFTEQGIAMLSAVLRSETAIQISIRIMETFVEMRKYLANNNLLLEKVKGLEARQVKSEVQRASFEERTEQRFEQVFEYISAHKESNQKIFFNGQIFDAFSLLTSLVQRADRSIILIDGYVDIGTLNILAKKKDKVYVKLYTLPGGKLTAHDIGNFNAQYPKLKVKHTTAFHDRFLMLDDAEGYHIGASIKDAGKKCFAINKIEDVGVIKDILQRAELTS